MKSTLANWEIAVFAVNGLGGAARRVATEDVALKCFDLAPDAFSWVKYLQFPDKDVVRSALVDARKDKNGRLLQGRAGRGKGQLTRTNATPSRDGWMLTEAGARWIRENESRIAQQLGQRNASDHRQEHRQRLSRLQSHRLYKQFLSNSDDFNPSLGDLGELFRCRVDASQLTWERRFNTARILAEAVNEQIILRFIEKCKMAVERQLLSDAQ